MATKLYPPNIEGTIPAFSGTTLVVPFSLNRAVSKSEIAGFVVKIKTVQGSVLLKTIKQMDSSLYDLDEKMQVSFPLGDDITLNLGQYYKIQLAFISNTGTVGYYSTVGVVKYTSEPLVEITGLLPGAINNHVYHYTGIYNQQGENKDTSEKMYSGRFKVYDSNNNIIKDSGELIHNVTSDVNAYESYEEFELNMDLDINSSYYIVFEVTTNNGLVASSPRYRIMQKKSVAPDLKASLDAKLSFEDGYIDLYLIGEKDSAGIEQTAVGSFIVCRAASNENYVWNRVCEFSLQSQTPTRFLWRDYTIEQGVTYKYSVQQYNDYGLYSDRILSKSVVADFEDAFLYDGERQLKIRYNPKISSFKTDILENKVETIGRKYPFVFRNGSVYYKEFPISGLISYQMDDNKLFMNWNKLGVDKPIFDFTSDAMLAERLFKLEVLEWLNDGKEKLFRSPTEGNYIVRLMNVSLSPTDTLGRMLHTFNTTAYEVADFTYDNLNKYKFITITNATTYQRRWVTVPIAGHSDDLDAVLGNVKRYVNSGVGVTVSEEQYNRIIGYDYSLKEFFSNQTVINSYALSTLVTQEILTAIGTALGAVVSKDKVFTPAEYVKITTHNSKFKDYFVEKHTTLAYTLANNVSNAVISKLEEIIGSVTYATGQINSRPVYSIFAVDMMPGTIIQLCTKRPGQTDLIEEIEIGATGSYNAEFESPISAIIIPQRVENNQILINGLQGSITYSYQSTAVNIFDTVRSLDIIDRPIQQWIGKQEKTYYNREQDKDITTNDLIEIIEDEKTTITDIFLMRFEKRPLQKIFTKALYAADGNEANGILISKIPDGVRLVENVSTEARYAPHPSNLYYYETRSREIPNKDDPQNPTIVYDQYYRLETNKPSEDKVYYVKVYDYYEDMDCKGKVDLNNLDCYYVYQICNGRFDYTYKDVWFEGDYVTSNFEHGYYIDKNGKQHPVFTGKLLDGLSTNSNIIIYDSDTYSNKVTINGDTIDLTETERYSVVRFDTPIKTLTFDNGIICELSYQIRQMSYNVEYTDQTVLGYKNTYLAYKDMLADHRMLYSVIGDREAERAKVTPGSSADNDIIKKYEASITLYSETLRKSGQFQESHYMSEDSFKNLEQNLMNHINEAYKLYIRQLTIALKNYKEANSVL